jgi:enoyl-[acyl-carrier protein] reductase I
VTGVVNRESIAYAVAAQALESGAEVVLTSHGRARRIAERAAVSLGGLDVLELDVTQEDHYRALVERLGERWDAVDGVVHAVAFAPPDALGGDFLATPAASAKAAFEVSAFSLKALADALSPLLPRGGSIVGFDFDASVAWPHYDWMGVSKAALESVARYLARDLGPSGVRVNLVASGVLKTVAARGLPGYAMLADAWCESAPLGWSTTDPTPVADAACFLLSDWSRAVTGEILHVDGGVHALGFPGLTAERRRSSDGQEPAPSARAAALERP